MKIRIWCTSDVIWLYFSEVIINIKENLKDYDVTINKVPDYDALNLVFGAAPNSELVESYNLDQDKLIIVNYEQLSYDGYGFLTDKYFNLLKKYKVWDYSTVNQKWLKQNLNVNADLLRLGYCDQLDHIPVSEKTIDVLFIGHMNDRRRRLYNILRNDKTIKKVEFLSSSWGETKLSMIARSKIVLNLHYYQSTAIFEWVRVSQLLNNKVFVISEISNDDQDYQELNGGLVRVEYSDIHETINYYLTHERERLEIADLGYQKIKNMNTRIPNFTTLSEEKMQQSQDFCLVMIVRDEAPVITRCIDSILPLLDQYLICDTGSVDNTPEIIDLHMKKNNIPGKVIHKQWKNFAYNRSHVFEQAYLTVQSKYFILMDADEVLLKSDKSPLTLDDRHKLLEFLNAHPSTGMFTMSTYFADIIYPRIQVVRNNQLYTWFLPVQELLINTELCNTTYVPFIINLSRHEGNSSRNPNRIDRDIQMLIEFLEEEKDEPRAVFYLGDAYHSKGDYENAILWYDKRSKLTTGYKEEVYIALLRKGRLHEYRDEDDQAIESFTIATEKFPNRLEAFSDLMMLLDGLDMSNEAYSVGKRAPFKETFNHNDLFIEYEVYNWLHQYRLGIVALYADEKDHGKALITELLDNNKVPESKIEFVTKQLAYFE